MLFNDLSTAGEYLDDMYWLGVVFWYDGPLETLYYNKNVDQSNPDEYIISMMYTEEEGFHYYVVPYRIGDYAAYLLEEISVNELTATVPCAYTILLEDDEHGVQRFMDIKPVPTKDILVQMDEDVMYYSQRGAKDEEKILEFFDPVMRSIKRKLKIENLL